MVHPATESRQQTSLRGFLMQGALNDDKNVEWQDAPDKGTKHPAIVW